jgi:hypothetical protein
MADEAETWNSDVSTPGKREVGKGEFTCVFLSISPWDAALLQEDQSVSMMQMTSITEYTETGVGSLMSSMRSKNE